MCVRNNPLVVVICLGFCLAAAGPAKDKGTADDKAANEKPKKGEADRLAIADKGPAVLWSDPADIESRNLFYGPGGSEHVPKGPFTFVKEDMNGTNPKFDIKAADGTKWKVKLGNEARPETAASRIVWAVGYQANADYFVPELHVEGMPAHPKRRESMIEPGGVVRNVRLKLSDEKKLGTWPWRQNAFSGTRELNGLRVLMAVIDNWDLKDENNAIYKENGERVYMISDLGASFGCPNRCFPKAKAKGDIGSYSHSKFIRSVHAETVSFENPGAESLVYAFNAKEYWNRLHIEWIGRNIPRADAKWMGQLLSRLSADQIHDAFRAAGYSDQEVQEFTSLLQGRIKELTAL